ncbi:MAG: acyltransferase [Planctomycetaceae bacterium]|nr:acyltransferase [Planctomycetaceae bacterium]
MSSKIRSRFRDFICGVFILLTFPFWGLVRIRLVDMTTFSELFSLVPGIPGVWLRRAYHVMVLRSCAADVGISFGTIFSKSDVIIEKNVSLGGYCIIGSCHIKSGTLIGSNIDVLSGRHQHQIGEKVAETPATYKRVTIGQNVWIGNGAIIMNDVGDHCVIGAGSVVVHPVPNHSLAVGNPAVVKKKLGVL